MIESYDFSFFIYRSMGIETITTSLSGDSKELTLLEDYKASILQAFTFPESSIRETKKKNEYELEMFPRLAYEFESLEPIEQKEFKEKFKELLQVRRDHSVAKTSRREFLEDREVLLPLTF